LSLIGGFGISKVVIEKTKKVRLMHRWLGRISVLLMVLTIIFGFLTPGLL